MPIPSPGWRRFRQATSLARSLVSPLPSKALYACSWRYRARLREIAARRHFDLVLLNGADLLWLLDELPESPPRVLVAHNIEHRLFASQVRSATWLPVRVKRLLDRDHVRLEDYEINGFKRVGNIIFLSRDDAAFASDCCSGLNTTVFGPVFDYPGRARRAPEKGPELHLGFLGSFSWWPNVEGVRWFVDQVLPGAGEHVRLHLFGECSHEVAEHRKVTPHGFVADLATVWDQCHFMVSPVWSGGGISIKVAEAIHNRMPVLATSFAARGLELHPDPAVQLFDSDADWTRFLHSAEAWELARREPLAENATRFGAGVRGEVIQDYIRRVIAEAR